MPSDIFVARQPIFDRHRRVTAYELHHRAGRLAGVGSGDDTATAVQLLDDAVLGIGLDTLLDDRIGLLRVPQEVLLGGQVTSLPADRIVLHVTPTDSVGTSLVAASREARKQGLRLALSQPAHDVHPELLEQASFVSLDFRQVDQRTWPTLGPRLRGADRQLLAKHIDSYDAFHQAQAAGFDYFQGPFFCEPELFSTRELNPTSHSMMILIAEVNRPELDLAALETLIRHDLALSVKLLRYLNSAGLGWRHEVSTIGQALRILGQRPARKWASLVALTMVATDKPSELFTTSLIRAQLCEEIGALVLGESRRAELFLIGLLSTLEALLDRPMSMLVSGMGLKGDASAALTGEASPLTRPLQLAIAYDQGNWVRVDDLAASLGIDPVTLPDAYHRSINWVAEVLSVE